MGSPKNMKNIKIKKPYCSKDARILSYLLGIKLKRIWEPSNGGIGIRLNIPQRKL